MAFGDISFNNSHLFVFHADHAVSVSSSSKMRRRFPTPPLKIPTRSKTAPLVTLGSPRSDRPVAAAGAEGVAAVADIAVAAAVVDTEVVDTKAAAAVTVAVGTVVAAVDTAVAAADMGVVDMVVATSMVVVVPVDMEVEVSGSLSCMEVA